MSQGVDQCYSALMLSAHCPESQTLLVRKYGGGMELRVDVLSVKSVLKVNMTEELTLIMTL